MVPVPEWAAPVLEQLHEQTQTGEKDTKRRPPQGQVPVAALKGAAGEWSLERGVQEESKSFGFDSSLGATAQKMAGRQLGQVEKEQEHPWEACSSREWLPLARPASQSPLGCPPRRRRVWVTAAVRGREQQGSRPPAVTALHHAVPASEDNSGTEPVTE